MTEVFQKINQLDELIESGADPEVVARFVLKLESDFLRQATANVQEGKYELAVRDYFLALLLPDRSTPREEIFGRALRAYLQLDRNGNSEGDHASLKLPEFAGLMAEMSKRVADEKRKDLDVRFAELDGRASLRSKDFEALDKVLTQMGESIQTRYLVAQLRLSRERKAQQFFEQIILRFRTLAEEEDFSSLRAKLDGEIDTLRKKAVIFSTGIHPIYGDQIREYMRRAEELFARSHTETVIDQFHKEGSKLLNEEFAEFKGNIKPDVEPVEVLRTIVKALRIFRAEDLFDEVQRISAEWAGSEAELRYRLLAIEQPEAGLSQVNQSISLIEEHQGILPVEISVELKAFLVGLRDESKVREVPLVHSDPPPPPPRPAPKPGWLARLVAWLFSWLPGRRNQA
ncbi:MAG TPA: hypothetical protein VN643_13070 [Pyrinomonadaceae bacterium]|nr:hypothetical protein [Pyrinomonadaceae bacterium]